MMNKRVGAVNKNKIMIHTMLIIGALLTIGPFIWMILTSLKTYAESVQVSPVIIPSQFMWSNYTEIFNLLPFLKFMMNTVIVTIARTIGQLFLCSLAAYAFARIQFPGRNVLFLLTLSVLMVPAQVFLLPQYLIMVKLDWLNTLQAVIVPGLFSAFGTFLLRQFFYGRSKGTRRSGEIRWLQSLPNLLVCYAASCETRFNCTWYIYNTLVLE